MAKKRDEQNELDRLFNGGFTMFRNGLKDHIEAGQFSVTEFAVYSYLQLYANFSYGLMWTNAAAIATGWHHQSASVRAFQEAMQNLREKQYIDYPKGGTGKGQSFPVLILKAEPTHGVLKGSRLIGFTSPTYEQVRYVFPNASRAQGVLKTWVGMYFDRMHAVGCPCAECAQPVSCGVTLKEVRLGRTPKFEKLENLKDGEEGIIAPAHSSVLSHLEPFVPSGELVEDEVEVKK